jgi:hypothetical protein
MSPFVHRDRGRIKRVDFEDVSARFGMLGVNIFDESGLRRMVGGDGADAAGWHHVAYLVCGYLVRSK